MDEGDKLYTKEPDGTVQKWYVWGWFGPRFAVAAVPNAKRAAYKRYYHMDDVGKTIFLTKREANHAPCPKPTNAALTLSEFGDMYAKV